MTYRGATPAIFHARVDVFAGLACVLTAALSVGCSDEGGTGPSTASGGSGDAPSTAGGSSGGGRSGGQGGQASASGGAPSGGTTASTAGSANGASAGNGAGATSGSGGSQQSGGMGAQGGTGIAGTPGASGASGATGGAGSSGGGSGGEPGAAGVASTGGSGGTIDVGSVSTSCPGAVPAGITASWCSCEQWGQTTIGPYTYYNNLWGEGPGPQCVWRADSGAWGVASTHPSGGGIKSYPNVSLSPQTVIANINTYTSSFDAMVPGGGVYDTAYDLWVKGTTSARIEIMLWMSWRGGAQPIAKAYDASGAIPDVTNVMVGGHTWNVYYGTNGANDVASFLLPSNTGAATVDIKAILAWLIANNQSEYAVFDASYTLDQVQFGHEITSDSGTQAYVTKSFSVTSN